MSIIEQKKIVLKSIINILNKNKNLGKESGVPQAAVLVDSRTWNVKHEAVVNKNVKGKEKWPSWMKNPRDTHAEKIIFHNYEDKFNNEDDQSLTLIVTSMPCESCLTFILNSPHYKKISSIVLLTNEYKIMKINNFLKKQDNQQILERFKGLSITIFDTNSDNNLKKLIEECLRDLSDFQEKYIMNFIDLEFIQNNSDSKRIKYTKEELKNYKDHLRLIEEIFEYKIFIYKKDKIIVKLSKIRDIWESDKEYQSLSNKIMENRQHKPIWKKKLEE